MIEVYVENGLSNSINQRVKAALMKKGAEAPR